MKYLSVPRNKFQRLENKYSIKDASSRQILFKRIVDLNIIFHLDHKLDIPNIIKVLSSKSIKVIKKTPNNAIDENPRLIPVSPFTL